MRDFSGLRGFEACPDSYEALGERMTQCTHERQRIQQHGIQETAARGVPLDESLSAVKFKVGSNACCVETCCLQGCRLQTGRPELLVAGPCNQTVW